MANRAPASPAPPVRRFEMRDLWRVVFWGVAAAGAVVLAIFVSTTNQGNHRLMVAAAHFRLVPQQAVAPVAQAPVGQAPIAQVPRPTESAETKQLAEAVKSLAIDRDRLLARLNTLEKTLDVTASVPRTPDLQPAAAPTVADPTPITVPTVMPRPSPQAQISAPQTQAAVTPEPAPPTAPSRAEFGIDLGASTTVEGLRVLWTNAKSRYGGVLEGLRPVMLVRDHARPGGVELRLIAGPVTNAAAAARLCNAMIGAVCQPAVYEGQRLALR